MSHFRPQWLLPPLLAFCLCALATLNGADKKPPKGVWTDPKDPSLPVDFKIQGEYGINGKIGCHVIALGNGRFQAVVYPGGLPGAGWDGKNKSLLDGRLEGNKAVFGTAMGKRRYLARPADQFSATIKFPPQGQKEYEAVINNGILTLMGADGKVTSMKKVNRASLTMGKEPPAGAIVLFNGTDTREWKGGRLDDKTKLLNTDGRDILTHRKFNNYVMHIEFLLPYRPDARGQGRGNSGFYQVDHYEMQILDSFGLEGKNNECGGIYQRKDPDVNICFPPLTWQTYDVDFTNAVAKDGKKVKNAVFSARHNGVVIHDKFEIPGKTGGSRRDPEGTPGPIKLQGHGNPLQFRNIWILEKK